MIQRCTEACRAAVKCATCGNTKAPRGRSAPVEMWNSLCSVDCPGYDQDPPAPHLWPNEPLSEEESK